MFIESYFRKYLAQFAQNPPPLWNYEAGVLFLGAKYMYETTGDAFYLEQAKLFMEHHILPDGTIRYLNTTEHNLDKINTGKALFFLYDATGEEKYKRALDILIALLHEHPRTETGNFWHKEIYPYQIWLDGLYMALPLYMEYENRFHEKENYNDIMSQMSHVRRLLYSEEHGLYYHAYDEKKQMLWADKETGLSHQFWLRSIGWHLMALIDLYELCAEEVFEQHHRYAVWFKEALNGILPYRDAASGLFYQLIALPNEPGNYLETSGSAMIAYCILKACRLGVLHEEKYRPIGEEILSALIATKMSQDDTGEWHLNDICEVAGLGPGTQRDGSVAYYLSEPIVSDEVKGVGALLMAYSEHCKLKQLDPK